MDLGIADQVAIVTGASRGLGFCAAQALADEGVRVLAVARSSGGLERLADSRPSLITPLACDLRDLDAVEALPAAAIERFGRLDILVNNAGIAPAGGFIEITRELLDEVMVLNVEVPALLTRAAGQVFIDRGGGKVINVASISGIRGKATLVAYSASKGALVQLTKALAAEWARYNIQVNAIAPGDRHRGAGGGHLLAGDARAPREQDPRPPDGRRGRDRPDRVRARVTADGLHHRRGSGHRRRGDGQDMTVIDVHTHAWPDAIAERAVAGSFSDLKRFGDGRVQSLVEALDRSGIDRAVCLAVANTPRQVEGANRFVGSLDRERFIGFGSVHAGLSVEENLAALRTNRLCGVKIHALFQNYGLDDPGLLRTLDAMQGEFIALFHVGAGNEQAGELCGERRR